MTASITSVSFPEFVGSFGGNLSPYDRVFPDITLLKTRDNMSNLIFSFRVRWGACRLLLACLVVPLPVVAQGPRAAGLQHPAPARSAVQVRRSSHGASDGESRAARGAAIGFAVGVVMVLVASTGGSNNDKQLAGSYAVVAGVVGGFIGYLVGRRY